MTGRPIGQANITVSSLSNNLAGGAISDASGYYYLPLLSPGLYLVRVTAPAFQSQEVQELELAVAARIELDFRLRPLNDVWESGEYRSVFLPGSKTIVTFYGPDVDTSRSGSFEAQKGRRAPLESTVSEVIDSGEIENLPLAGRDVYTMLVTQPGVTSDASTGRGLGLSINGQRPSSSNFLLDGVENNNYLITGPLMVLPPEAIQEYRVSTNNFSAEYGRTSGFLANAITVSGSERFHGVGFFYIKNDALNANNFQDNLQGAPRTPDKEIEPGFVVGGPVLHNRLYFSSVFDKFRSRSAQAPFTFIFPTQAFINFATPTSNARKLLTQYAPPVLTNGPLFTAPLTLLPPVAVDRWVAIQRLDYVRPNGKDRALARVFVNRLAQPDFIWSPYPDFISALHQYTWATAFSYVHSFRANLTNEARFSYSDDNLHWNRPHPEIPSLTSQDGAALPGSPAFYAYRNVNQSAEFLDNLIWAHGRHLITAGGGFLARNSDGFLTAGQVPQYLFGNVVLFAIGSPSYIQVAIDRTALPSVIQLPAYDRTYHYNQVFGFAQDTYKLASRLTVNYGIRYEYYGGPQNTGSAKDALIHLGSGSGLAQQLASATLVKPSAGDQQEFGADTKDFAVRVGAAYDLFGSGRTMLRGAYGIFYDRPFDNLWQNARNNNFVLPLLTPPPGFNNFLAPVSTLLPLLKPQQLTNNFPDLTLVDPSLKNGYAHSYFAGIQHRVTNDLIVELNTLGTYGRRLITTDIVNRDFSTPQGRYNPAMPDIAYRANQGFSDYNALAAVVRYRLSRGIVQASYTWSHYIDNQSEPLLGDFFNLKFTQISSAGGSSGRAAFTQQFNPQVDRGNSDFDQRHNLVVFSYWNPPGLFGRSKIGILFRDWTFGELAAFRSGFPYTVNGVIGSGAPLLNNRPNIIDPNRTTYPDPLPAPGGERLLNPAGFAQSPNAVGNEGRNAFRGPGFYNVDLSVARSFGLPWLGEGGRLTFRADAFNVLNHANLANPDSLLTDPLSPTFGIATFGRQGRDSGFPAVTPLNETARQVQLSVKVQF